MGVARGLLRAPGGRAWEGDPAVGLMSWDNLVRRNLKPLMRAAGLPETTRPYDLRHTFATLMLEQGENPKVVQEVLGHSRITHTMDTYSHVSPNIQKEAFGRLGKRLGGS